MKWLFITSHNGADFSPIEDLLKKKNAECVFLYSDEVSEDKIEANILETVKNVDFIVYNFDENLLHNVNIVFMLGYTEGKNITSFIDKKADFDSEIIYYKNMQDLKRILKKNLAEYVSVDERKKALSKLYELGIPFTPDCFSFEIAKNNFEVAELFVKAGMSANERDSAGTPMICVATRAERKKMIEWLFNNGADINAVSKDRGYSAVMDAVWRGDFELVKYFIELGANVNFVANDGQTALILATGSGKEKICEILFKNGADPNFKDHMNMSALDYAILFRKENLINLYKEIPK